MIKSILAAFILLLSTSAIAQDTDLTKRGKKVSAKCKACHTFKEGGRNKVGPNLFAVFDRKAGEVEEYKYSKALLKRKDELVWTEENLDSYLKKPRKFLPKGKMAFGGIKKDKDRKALIEYIKTLK